MSTLNNFYPDQQKHETGISIFQNIVSKVSGLSESIWLGVTFLLFILMGPFSIIAVLYGLWILGSAENREKMAEPVRC
jgi:hypothetical protein